MHTHDPSSEPPADAVRVRFWAAARAAAGVEEAVVPGRTVGDAVEAMGRRSPALAELLPLCALLVDGQRVASDQSLPAGALLEVLPPFAGG